jgi:hypothetical protein
VVDLTGLGRIQPTPVGKETSRGGARNSTSWGSLSFRTLRAIKVLTEWLIKTDKVLNTSRE